MADNVAMSARRGGNVRLRALDQCLLVELVDEKGVEEVTLGIAADLAQFYVPFLQHTIPL